VQIWELDKLGLFIAFVIPGFISIKCYQLLFPGTERPTADQIIDAIAYSSINYAILFVPIILVENSGIKASHIYIYYAFYVIVLFIAPILWVVAWKYLRTHDLFQRNAPHPTAKPWDYVFAQRKQFWLKIILKDGTIIAGRYGPKSFASSAPAEEQIYLEESWIINENGGFLREKKNTAGVMVLSREIAYIEFRNDGETDAQRQETN
jgi:hypothetical protein